MMDKDKHDMDILKDMASAVIDGIDDLFCDCDVVGIIDYQYYVDNAISMDMRNLAKAMKIAVYDMKLIRERLSLDLEYINAKETEHTQY